MSDKVLAEIARRRELAKFAVKEPWSTIGDPVDPSYRILIQADHETLATVYGDFNNAEFIADSGTHRARELEALETALKLARECRQSITREGLLQGLGLIETVIERAVLGEGGGG